MMILLTGLPYLGYDHLHDERAIRLSQIGVDTIYAAAIAKVVCKQLTLPDLTISIDGVGLDFLAKEGPFDEETVEAIIDVADDARYEEEKEGIGARIVFDGPLTHDGICIPVDLLVHELAHHVEWHGSGDRLEGHLEAFGDAVPVVTEAVWQLLHLDRWTEQQWLEIAPKVPQPTVDIPPQTWDSQGEMAAIAQLPMELRAAEEFISARHILDHDDPRSCAMSRNRRRRRRRRPRKRLTSEQRVERETQCHPRPPRSLLFAPGAIMGPRVPIPMLASLDRYQVGAATEHTIDLAPGRRGGRQT